MGLTRLTALAATAGITIAAAPAATTTDAAAFGAREAIAQISLSPDGNRIAMLSPFKGAGDVLLVADLVAGGAPKPILSANGSPEKMRACYWSSDTRLTCTIVVTQMATVGRVGFTRLVAINADGSGLKTLSTTPSDRALNMMQEGGTIIDLTASGKPGAVLMTRQFIPEQTTGTWLAESREGLGVDEVDTQTLVRRNVEPPRKGAVEYISDGRGSVRIMGVQASDGSGYIKDRISYFYRKTGSRAWLPLSQVTSQAGFDPYAVDPALDVAYGFDEKDGRRALYRMPLDGSGRKEVVLARPDVDVDGLISIGRQHRVVGTSWAVERREAQFFDPELTRLGGGLARALPGQHNVIFVDASADEKKLLLYIGSDTDPGRYYLYTKDNHHLDEVLPLRPELEKQPLASVKAITFRAADGTSIPAYLTLPPGSDGKGLPAIVMPHGGPGDRDEWGFDWLSQYFAHGGYAVLQPEYRGSSGYGTAWFQQNGFRSWKTAIGDVNDAGRYLLSSGIAAPGKLAIVGWSYGGYAALQSAVLDPDLFKAIVAVAPVTDLQALKDEHRAYTDYNVVAQFVGEGPQVREGSPAQNAARIKAPVLIFHGDLDQNVGVGESRLMAARLKGAGKKVNYVEFRNLDHQLEDDGARATLLGQSDAFLRASLGL